MITWNPVELYVNIEHRNADECLGVDFERHLQLLPPHLMPRLSRWIPLVAVVGVAVCWTAAAAAAAAACHYAREL